MTEAYTVGADAEYKCTWKDRGGQTFRPIRTHELLYVDLQLRALIRPRTAEVFIYRAGANHTPITPPISQSLLHETWFQYPNQTARIRFRMQRVTLEADQYYAMVLTVSEEVLPHFLYWKYDSTAAKYYRGQRISSTDFGVTWAVHYGQDHLFAEFGSPESPNIHPTPPILNFAPTRFDICHLTHGVYITLTTNVPCHLTLYWTDVTPKKHALSRVIRGLNVPWDVYFCFVSYHEVPQLQLGDTLYHTFRITEWAIDKLYYYTIRGTVDEVQSPSVGPIFHTRLRKLPPLLDLTLRPNNPGDVCAITWGCTPCPNHYTCVNEEIPDGDTTTLWAESIPGFMYDLYKIGQPPPMTACIDSVRLYARARRVEKDKFGNPYIPIDSLKISLQILGIHDAYPSPDPWGNAIMLTTLWDTYNTADYWNLNPSTGAPWTWEEIAMLQIGVWLRRAATTGIWIFSYCTQLYAKINYLSKDLPF